MSIRLTLVMNTKEGNEFRTNVIEDLVDEFSELAYERLGLEIKNAFLDQVIELYSDRSSNWGD